MKEIVLIKSYLYRKETGVFLDRLLDDNKAATNKWGNCKILWWFDCPNQNVMTLEKAATRTEQGKAQGLANMVCDAIRFQFEPLPNPKAAHFDTSVLYSHWDFDGNRVFLPFVDQLVAITRAKLSTDEWDSGADFYGLFEIETDENRAIDGGLDYINVWAEFLGEFDIEAAPLTEHSREARQKLLNHLVLNPDEEAPHYEG